MILKRICCFLFIGLGLVLMISCSTKSKEGGNLPGPGSEPKTILTVFAHPDHRLLGAITTELLLREGLSDKIDLYFFGWTREQAEKYSWWGLNYMDSSVLNTEIHFSQEDEEKAMNSIRCHKSQYKAEEMEDWIRTEVEDLSNVSYFRKFQLDPQKRNEF